MTFKCPICKKDVATGNAEFPFCSARCRLIDLGNWASEKYVVPGAPDPQRNPQDDEED